MALRPSVDLAQLALASASANRVEQLRAHLIALIERLDGDSVERLWRFVAWWINARLSAKSNNRADSEV